MYGSDRSTGRRGFHTILLIFLALLAGLLAGTFLDSGGSTEQEPPPESSPAGISQETNGEDEATPPAAGATEDGVALYAVETPASPPSPAAPAQDPAAVGAPAPDFTLPDLFDEETTYILSAYRDRPVILNFWASWCVPCRREMPALQGAADRYGEEGLQVLGIDQAYTDSLGDARLFVRELGLTFPSARDDDGHVSTRLYGVMGLPTSVFITPSGDVAHIQIGEMSAEQVETFTQRLLAGERPQP